MFNEDGLDMSLQEQLKVHESDLDASKSSDRSGDRASPSKKPRQKAKSPHQQREIKAKGPAAGKQTAASAYDDKVKQARLSSLLNFDAIEQRTVRGKIKRQNRAEAAEEQDAEESDDGKANKGKMMLGGISISKS